MERENELKNFILIMKKMLFYLFSAGCILMCILLYLIKERGADTILDIEINEESVNNFSNVGLANNLDNQRVLLKSMEEELKFMQVKYELLTLLEQKANENGKENPEMVYEKYFQLRQGALARCAGIKSAEECDRIGFINSHFGGIAIQIDEGIFVQYRNISYIEEYLLPGALIITEPDIDLGYMNARAGMDFKEIQKNAYEGEIEKGFMYNEELYVYFIKFSDEFYDYQYVSDYPDGSSSWLFIEHRTDFG